VTGFLRGRNLSVNGLVHILGWGDFQMTQIDARNDPYPLYPKSDKHKVCKKRTSTIWSDICLRMLFYREEGSGKF
jgi:pre-rRNA-processing protein TSR1